MVGSEREVSERNKREGARDIVFLAPNVENSKWESTLNQSNSLEDKWKKAFFFTSSGLG